MVALVVVLLLLVIVLVLLAVVGVVVVPNSLSFGFLSLEGQTKCCQRPNRNGTQHSSTERNGAARNGTERNAERGFQHEKAVPRCNVQKNSRSLCLGPNHSST